MDTILGKCVLFGTYKTRNADDRDDISWIVLQEDNEKLLLLSKYVIDVMSFHDIDEETTWERCSLRRWLNWDFYDTAFSEAEQASILQVRNSNHDIFEVKKVVAIDMSTDRHQMWRNIRIPTTLKSLDTLDKVFLLSVDEAKQYKTVLGQLLVEPTPYAMQKCYSAQCEPGALPDSEFHKTAIDYFEKWWLRTRGSLSDSAYYAGLGISSWPVCSDKSVLLGVRPAIWIKSDAMFDLME